MCAQKLAQSRLNCAKFGEDIGPSSMLANLDLILHLLHFETWAAQVSGIEK